MANEKNDTSSRELLISQTLNAPIELVWEVWTQPQHLAQWWGPDGFSNTIQVMDVKPGGEFNLTMHAPDGTGYRNKSIYTEVVLHKKLVYDHLTGPKFTATVDFEAQGESTHIRWRLLFESEEEFIRTVKTFKADVGLKQNVEKLAVYVKGLL